MLLHSRNFNHSTIFATHPRSLISLHTPTSHESIQNATKVHNHITNAVQSFQQPCTVVTCDDRCCKKVYSVVAQKITNPPLRSPQVATLQPHITAAYNFHDFPYFPAFPHFPKNSPFPPFPVKPINQETIPTPR